MQYTGNGIEGSNPSLSAIKKALIDLGFFNGPAPYFLPCYTEFMSETLFTRIINGEIPSYKLYEDDKTFAFLDIHPVQPGHILIVPKNPVEFVWDLPDDDYVAVMMTTKKLALRIRERLGSTYVHERIIGVHVPHAHVQLIPFNHPDELQVQADFSAEPDHSALQEMASKLA
ncbi:MAG: hypothetical protein JWM37_206 [Candidatus Saccharibacteria bacterium]|nr:hypothetical protein [Candidatus Saccharibacteria bacterium]